MNHFWSSYVLLLTCHFSLILQYQKTFWNAILLFKYRVNPCGNDFSCSFCCHGWYKWICKGNRFHTVVSPTLLLQQLSMVAIPHAPPEGFFLNQSLTYHYSIKCSDILITDFKLQGYISDWFFFKSLSKSAGRGGTLARSSKWGLVNVENWGKETVSNVDGTCKSEHLPIHRAPKGALTGISPDDHPKPR